MASAKELGKAIAYLRGRRTQAEVARRARINPAIWSLYETGRRRPREGTFDRVLRGLRCTRLELEEVAWHFHRQRLIEEEGTARRAGSRQFVDSARQAAERLRWSAPDGEAEPVRRELRALLSHVAILLEEVILVAREEAPTPRPKREQPESEQVNPAEPAGG